MNNVPLPAREVIEDMWRERLRSAHLRYEALKRAAHKANEIRMDAPVPDGEFGFRRALQAETAALAEYRRILIIFSNLILHGTLPEDSGQRTSDSCRRL
jgi:hypothetical protein